MNDSVFAICAIMFVAFWSAVIIGVWELLKFVLTHLSVSVGWL